MPYSTSTEQSITFTSSWVIAKDPLNTDSLGSLPDSLWQKFDDHQKYTIGNWLIRTSILISDSSTHKKVLGIFARNFISAFELYWDGKKLIQNGTVGITLTEEREGVMHANAFIPPELLTIGEHTIILRISNHSDYSKWKWYHGHITIGEYDKELQKSYELGYMIFFTAGILLIPFLLNLYLYVARNSAFEHLLFCLVCMIILVDRIVLLLPSYVTLPANYIHGVIYTFYISRVIRSILFPWYFVLLFSLPHSAILFLLIVVFNGGILFFVSEFFQIPNWMTGLLLVECGLITLFALIKKREGSLIIAIGILIATFVFIIQFQYIGAASILAIFSTLVVGRKFVEKEKEEQRAKLRAARIEIELLKKSINSHFVLNSLSSIIVWLRKNPKAAIQLIDALAKEFRCITQVSAMKLIPISQELEICKHHLSIMSYRRGITYKLETHDIDENEMIPPLIFHTLIENGITHSNVPNSIVSFILKRKRKENYTQYIFTQIGSTLKRRGKQNSGVGLKYISLRLEESFPHRWNIRSGKSSTGWKTIIEIKDK
ncbi:MAG: histidine kinase [Spirochaetes bacterium]|nr:histidine kinase [Spirochaetota bacterium]